MRGNAASPVWLNRTRNSLNSATFALSIQVTLMANAGQSPLLLDLRDILAIEISLQCSLKVAAGVVEAAHDSAYLNLQGLCDFFVCQPVDFTKHDNRAVLFGKHAHSAVNLLAKFGTGINTIRIRAQTLRLMYVGRCKVFLKIVIEFDFLGSPAAAITIDREIVGDTINPGEEFGFRLKFVNVLIDADKAFLGYLKRILAIAHNGIDSGNNAILVAPEKQLKSLHIAGLNLQDKLFVA